MLENASQNIAPFHHIVWPGHTQYLAPDFGMYELNIIRFSNGFQHCNRELIRLFMISM